MAEVLGPLVLSGSPGSTPQQHRRTSSDEFPQISAGQQQKPQQRIVQMPRNNVTGGQNASGQRATHAAPTYAFKATPQLKSEPRSPPGPTTPALQPLSTDQTAGNRQRYPAAPSVSTTSSSSNSSNPSSNPSTNTTTSTWSQLFTKDDSSITSNFQLPAFTTQPSSLADSFSASSTADALTDAPSKSGPDRYRRGHQRAQTNVPSPTSQQPPAAATTTTNGAAKPPSGAFTWNSQQPTFAQKAAAGLPTKDSTAKEAPLTLTKTSSNTSTTTATPSAPQAPPSMSRYRRRPSQNSVQASPVEGGAGAQAENVRPSSRQNTRSASPNRSGISPVRSDGSAGPARTFAEVARRTKGPSPLSRPMTPSESTTKQPAPSSPPAGPSFGQGQAFQNSPAIAAMAALNDKDGQKGVKSRLRRAFSFGSSAELRRAAAEGSTAADRAQARREQFSSELDEEQDAIARQQEAAGLGNSIYSGQAGFTGSTDNLSISSTASSASMMLRKMGKGMKKGGRSIKGLFRPKSAIGVAPPDGPLGASIGEISRVTVEAEREKVNVNADPHEQTGGGTGFPKLERNSVDAVRASVAQRDGEGDGTRDARRSFVGGEHERAEVLAAVKRGILKRSTTGSPVASPTIRPADASLTNHGNHSFERNPSPSPSNTSSEHRATGHRRTDPATVGGDDYFGGLSKMANQSSRSLPGTPRGIARISFSPRIQFHDVWSSSEYDRRGDIATCNRLTPMLAQQIKEELNTFKMEMEVHEASKPHTHFF